MDNALFDELINIGIDKGVAHKVAASLSPDHIATTTDILRLEKLILDTRLSSKKDLLRLEQLLLRQQAETRKEMSTLQLATKEEMTALQLATKTEMTTLQLKTAEQFGAHNRQFWITFGGMIISAFVLFAMNLYFHVH
ncbi:hypothetical protein [Endozoicomonas sp.]|uniref:hypothetical protein n=1 Tax=Endozoicomonas sp. TaxID=1892382 RepID=UPI0028879AFE|nr:hypothetical protein [Endozoicomonas sp.]